MKRSQILGALAFATIAFAACNNADYQTSAGGLKYKIIDGGSKDSSKVGDVLKMNVLQKIEGSKDTVITDTYGKLPAFVKIQDIPTGPTSYGPDEFFKKLKKGDSLITIMYVDSLIKKGIVQEAQMPPFMKKGDKIVLTFKVLEVFKNDSLAQADYQKEMEKDAPRQKKEQEEMMKKMMKDQEAAQKADEAALEKSGEKAKQVKAVQDFLTAKKWTATPTAVGTFVKIDQPGTGAQVADGKFVTVKYDGKKVSNDSTFDANQFTVQLGVQPFIKGFEDGLRQFKQGGKGTIIIPGYLAYGKEGNGGVFKPYEPLYFNVEIVSVSDKEPAPQPMPAPQAHGPNDGHNH
jgi:FKBP-type peptidyl-prolyl cis-trans isomerase